MAWTTPKTWVTEVLTSADMNTYIKNNTQYLYDQVTSSSSLASYTYTRNGGGNYQTTSTSWVDIDSSNMVVNLTTYGGDVLVTFASTINRGSGVPFTAFIALVYDNSYRHPVRPLLDLSNNVSFSYLFRNVPAGSHTYRMRWRMNTSASGATLNMIGLYTQFSITELRG